MITYPQYALPQAIDFTGNFGRGFDIGQGIRQNERNEAGLDALRRMKFAAPQVQPQGGALQQIGAYVAPQPQAPADPLGAMIDTSHARAAGSVDPALSQALGEKYGNSTQPISDPAKVALNYFVERGYSPHQAAGIIGNLMQESGLNTGARNPGDGRDGSDSIGIAQWNGPRAQALHAYAAQNGGSATDLNTQLAFIDHELNTTEAGVRQRLLQAQDPLQAAAAFVGYERPQGWTPDNPYGAHGWSNRARYAAEAAGGSLSAPTTAVDAANAMAFNAQGVPDVGAGEGQPFQLSGDQLADLMGSDLTRGFAQSYLLAEQERQASSGRFVTEEGPNGAVWQRDRLTGERRVLMTPDQTGAIKSELGLTPQYGVDANGNPVLIQIGKDGRAHQTQMPEGVTLSKEPIRLDAGTHYVLLDPITRQPVGQIPKDNYQEAYDTAAGSATGKADVENTLGASAAVASAENSLAMIDAVINDPNLHLAVGLGGLLPAIPNTPQAGVVARIEQLQGAAFLQAFESLKGGGQITEVEGKKATDAIARLNRAQSREDFITALNDLKAVIQVGLERARGQQPAGTPTTNGTARPQSQADYDALPSGALFIDPDDGQTYRKP